MASNQETPLTTQQKSAPQPTILETAQTILTGTTVGNLKPKQQIKIIRALIKGVTTTDPYLVELGLKKFGIVFSALISVAGLVGAVLLGLNDANIFVVSLLANTGVFALTACIGMAGGPALLGEIVRAFKEWRHRNQPAPPQSKEG
jgi:hypothetical protein